MKVSKVLQDWPRKKPNVPIPVILEALLEGVGLVIVNAAGQH